MADSNRQTKTLTYVIKLHTWISQLVVGTPQEVLQSYGAALLRPRPVCDSDEIVDNLDDPACASGSVRVRRRSGATVATAFSDAIE